MTTLNGPTARRDQGPAVIHIAAGSSHSTAVLDNGTVLSWGRGEDGQLGHGDADERRHPTAVYSLLDARITATYCGAEYCCAVSEATGACFSWGWGDFGRLGHDDVLDVFLPRQIQGLAHKKVAIVSCGDTHTCALTSDGKLFSFGRNQNGQLGINTDSDSLVPTPITALQGKRVVSVTCGAEHTLAATAEGDAFSWGWGRYGNLGDGHCADRWVPTRVRSPASARIHQVASGWRHSMIVDDGGRVYSFGWSKYGQLGHGDCEDQRLPQLVEGLQGHHITLISGGWRHTVAADREGQLLGWGWNKFGQLGIGSTEDVHAPVRLASISTHAFREVACGWRHTIAVTLAGEVFSWGRGVNGQLGHGDSDDQHTPRLLEPLSSGTMDKAALCTAVKPSSSFVATTDRYAVVPEDPAAISVVPSSKKAKS